MTGPNGPYKTIKPGMYLDRDGAVVFNVADILIEMGLEDTPGNRLELMLVIEEMIKETPGNPMEIIYRTPSNSEWRKLGDKAGDV